MPVPDLPALPQGTTPPAAVIGVLGVPDIMRASTAAQQVEKVIGERREKLNEDAQKEQAAWRDLQQPANQRAPCRRTRSARKEKELQERITNAQRSFRDRNRIIQETAQYGLSQIERTLIGVIRQVAESRGMNLVLHRAQVALNVNEFDITDQVTAQMNKVMPSVTIAAGRRLAGGPGSGSARCSGHGRPGADPGSRAGGNPDRAPLTCPVGRRGRRVAGDAASSAAPARTRPQLLAETAGAAAVASERRFSGVAPLQRRAGRKSASSTTGKYAGLLAGPARVR